MVGLLKRIRTCFRREPITCILILAALLVPADSQCVDDQLSDAGALTQAYLIAGLVIPFGAEIQSSCPDPFSTDNCDAFSDYIDTLIALGGDSQCNTEIYDDFETRRSGALGIQCHFDDIITRCPDATELTIAVDGGYSDWSDWSSCACDDTEETRTRDCDNPIPINDGSTCEEQGLGDDTETQSCTTTFATDECTSAQESEESDNSACGLETLSIWMTFAGFAAVTQILNYLLV